MAANGGAARTLEPTLILKTLRRLKERVHDRFPNRGLDDVCGDLVAVAQETERRVKAAQRSALLLRAGVVLVLVAAVGLALTLISIAELELVAQPAAEELAASPVTALQAFESGVNLVILAALAIWFLVSLEARWKRRTVLRHLHELRSFAHVVDMHQLTKDPVSILNPSERLPSSPERDLTPFQLARYLDYCVEMLSLIGKLAALYAEQNEDTQIIEAASDIEDLTTNLSRKIWQKVVVIGEAATTPVAPAG